MKELEDLLEMEINYTFRVRDLLWVGLPFLMYGIFLGIVVTLAVQHGL